jgi:hypothetical protein
MEPAAAMGERGQAYGGGDRFHHAAVTPATSRVNPSRQRDSALDGSSAGLAAIGPARIYSGRLSA